MSVCFKNLFAKVTSSVLELSPIILFKNCIPEGFNPNSLISPGKRPSLPPAKSLFKTSFVFETSKVTLPGIKLYNRDSSALTSSNA